MISCGARMFSQASEGWRLELLLDVEELTLFSELGEQILALAVLQQAHVVTPGCYQLFGAHAAIIAADHDLAALPGARDRLPK